MTQPTRTNIGRGLYADTQPAQGRETARILCFHGGGGVSGDPAMLAPFCALLGAGGTIATVAVSYRTHAHDGDATLDDMLADADHALAWARSGLPEGVKLYLLGASFGGLLALVAAHRAPAAVAGLILLNPVTDTGPDGFSNNVVPETGRTDVSPLALYRAVPPDPAIPCLIVHGRRDDVVPVGASRRLARRWPGAACHLIEVPRAPHGFFNRPPHDRTTAEQVAAFIADPARPPAPAAPAPTRKPAFPAEATMLFCIGAQKAGTSWLYEYLGRSPNCHLTPFKELHYFDVIHLKAEQSHLINRVQQLKQAAAALAETPGPKNRKALNTVRRLGELLRIYTGDAGDHSAYLAYLAEGWSGQKLICDVTPSYATLDRTAFAEMAGIGQARFVFILRDPVGRLWSQTRMAVSSRQGGLGDAAFEAACMSRLREIHQEARMSRLPRSDYAGTVAELEAAVPAERIHYAFYEDLFSQASADRLCRFLDIASVPAETDEQVNLGRSLGLPAEAEALMFDALRPQYEAMFEKFGRAVPQAWRDRYAARKGREPA